MKKPIPFPKTPKIPSYTRAKKPINLEKSVPGKVMKTDRGNFKFRKNGRND